MSEIENLEYIKKKRYKKIVSNEKTRWLVLSVAELFVFIRDIVIVAGKKK